MTYSRDGVTFDFPTDWRVEAEDNNEAGWAVSFHNPADTAFVLISLHPDADDPARLADETLAAMREVYTELDADNRVETIAGQAAIGYDLDILTVDVTVVCRIRSLQTPLGPLLIIVQTAEPEYATTDPVLRAVVASLVIEE